MTRVLATLLSLCIMFGCSKPPKEVFVDRVVEKPAQGVEDHLQDLQACQGDLTVCRQSEDNNHKEYVRMHEEHEEYVKKTKDFLKGTKTLMNIGEWIIIISVPSLIVSIVYNVYQYKQRRHFSTFNCEPFY